MLRRLTIAACLLLGAAVASSGQEIIRDIPSVVLAKQEGFQNAWGDFNPSPRTDTRAHHRDSASSGIADAFLGLSPQERRSQDSIIYRAQDQGDSGGGGDLSADATNPTAAISVYQFQNTFEPRTYEASGFAHILGLQVVKPFKLNSEFFPTWVTRWTLPVITTADPDGSVAIGPPNDTEFLFPIDNQSGLGDFTMVSILNHPTEWGSWGIGPGFVAPTATRAELGERSWKFSPTFVVVNTSIPTWQIGMLGVYNFPLDGRGSQSLLFQPLIVKQLGEGWYTGWGDDLWSFNMDSGNFGMPLQARLGKVLKIREESFNVFVTGYYTPDGLRQGPAPEWGIKLSISLLKPES